MGRLGTILFIPILWGCGGESSNKPQPSYADRLSELRIKAEKYNEWLSESDELKDEDGWIMTGKCDALLHNSLARIGGAEIDVFRARDENGRLWRRPGRDCLDSGGSRSTISRDMLLGYLLLLLHERRLEDVEFVIEYGEERGWVMGEHDGSPDGYSRVYANPSFQALWYQARRSLGGKASIKENVLQIYGNCSGFECHLQALTILARGMIENGLKDSELDAIRDLTDRDQNNALFWSIRKKFEDGDQNRAISIVLNNALFPDDRLPDSNVACIEYRWEHGENRNDWEPCPDEELLFPGHDLTFVSSIIFTDSYGFRAWPLRKSRQRF